MLNSDEECDKGHDIVAANSSWHKQVLLLQVNDTLIFFFKNNYDKHK
jgi:hypothetical protein